MNHDYLNRLEADNRPETWHDSRPSHPGRPDYINDAETERDDLWNKYDAILTEELFNTEMREPDYQRIERARHDAEAASRQYSQLYIVWQEEWQELKSFKDCSSLQDCVSILKAKGGEELAVMP